MPPTWREVEQANEEKRCELVLSGAAISKLIADEGLDVSIFKIKHLNFLEISKTGLEKVPEEVGDLMNLTRIVLHNNNLQNIPPSIGNLKKLKFLDISFNKITEIPETVSSLTDLQSLNFSYNQLSDLPSLINLVNLVSLNISHNLFTKLPDSLFDASLTHFSEFTANNNAITAIPANIKLISALKSLNFSENALTEIPGELAECTKLKELNLKGNKLKDKRLTKLIDQCHAKQVLDYVRLHCAKSNAAPDDSKQVKSKKKAKQNKKSAVSEEMVQLLDQITVLHMEDEIIKIILLPNVQEVRPYIVACVIKDLNFTKPQSLKKFITLQTKLHETVCEKRTVATIATHDLLKINGDLTYGAKEPKSFKITPLNRHKESTAAELYTLLNEEADAIRKEKKKNTYSGIHKYLFLLKDKPLYPCLIDGSNRVISFPPITNSDVTKVSVDTKHVFVEVTGNSLPTIKKVLDTLLEEVLKLELTEGPDDEDENSSCHMTVQQVKIVDEEGKLKVVYPSRTDILSDHINVIRN